MKIRVSFFLLLPVMFSAVMCAQKTREFKLESLSPKFGELISSDAKPEKIATDFGFTEGPMWNASGFLYVSDETIIHIFLVSSKGRKEAVIATGAPDGTTLDRHHRLLDCASVLRAIIEVTPEGNYTILADRYEGKRFNSPNDVIVAP